MRSRDVYEATAFQARVNFAAAYIAAGKKSTRRFDTCFEMWDGDAVAAALVRRADKRPTGNLAANLFRYIGEKEARECSARLGKNLGAEAARIRDEQQRRSAIDIARWAAENEAAKIAGAAAHT